MRIKKKLVSKNESGFSLAEMIVAAGLWLSMITMVSMSTINLKKHEALIKVEETANLLKIALSRYLSDPTNCGRTFTPTLILSSTSDTPISLANFPFKIPVQGPGTPDTNSDDLIDTLESGTDLMGNQLRLTSLTARLKFPNDPNNPNVSPIWNNSQPHIRNTVVVTANLEIKIGSNEVIRRLKTVEIPILMTVGSNSISSCEGRLPPNLRNSCELIGSRIDPNNPTTCQSANTIFGGTYQTQEQVGSAAYCVNSNIKTAACSCPVGATAYVTGIYDWIKQVSYVCGWVKKGGPTYCLQNVSMRDTYYVCITE